VLRGVLAITGGNLSLRRRGASQWQAVELVSAVISGGLLRCSETPSVVLRSSDSMTAIQDGGFSLEMDDLLFAVLSLPRTRAQG